MKKGIVSNCTDYPHIHHQEKGPRVADGSRASLVRQKTKRNRNSGSSLPNTSPVPSPVEPYCWGPSPVLNPGPETLLSLASHPSSQIRILRSRHSGPAFNHYSCHCPRMPNSSESYSHSCPLLLFSAFEIQSSQAPTHKMCVWKQTTFIRINHTEGWAYRINEARNKFALRYVSLWAIKYSVPMCMARSAKRAPLLIIVKFSD